MRRLARALRRLCGRLLGGAPAVSFERLLEEALRGCDRVTLRVAALERALADGRRPETPERF